MARSRWENFRVKAVSQKSGGPRGPAARRPSQLLFEASLFDLPDANRMAALPLGSSVESQAASDKNAAGAGPAAMRWRDRERSDRELQPRLTPTRVRPAVQHTKTPVKAA